MLEHIQEREDFIEHFYRDRHRLVTIGYGHLVETRAMENADAAIRAAAIALRNSGIAFLDADGNTAEASRVGDDAVAANNGRATRLVISKDTGAFLLVRDVQARIRQLYNKRPTAADLNPYIAAVLVDVLFNPGGVPLFNQAALWNRLDPSSPRYNLGEAIAIFDRIWGGAGDARYRVRHRKRLELFRRGILETAAAAQAPGSSAAAGR